MGVVSGGAASLVQRGGVSVRRAIGRALAGISPGLRRWLLIVAAACLVLAAAYQLWLRDSSLVAVEHVTVTGLTTSDAKRLRMALRNAGGTMTTLHMDRDALERAAAAYPVVRELEVTTDFPHGLRIHVIEHHPAAIAVSGAGRVPVAGDGTILRGLPVEGRLPIIHVDGALRDDRLEDGDGRAAAAVAGAAPPILRNRIVDVRRRSDDGLVANLREGPELIFGSATRLRAKWEAAARVLADLEARGTSYLDLRIPDRPAAGGLPAETVAPVAPAGMATTAPVAPAAPSAPQSAATDPAAAPPDQAAAPSPPANGAPPPTPTTPAPGAPDTAQPQPGTTLTGGPAGGATALPQP
jgi:cell division protein FtsQ